jgi:mRNA-degrading endonuclease RelE of RelBE toxin-antitoxin system
MNVNYLPSFIKELKSLKSTPYFKPINTLVFEEIPKLDTFIDIKNLKKLQGYDNAYRIRVGDYRIGIIFQDGTVTFYRVLHRQEIYRYFLPKKP